MDYEAPPTRFSMSLAFASRHLVRREMQLTHFKYVPSKEGAPIKIVIQFVEA